MKLAFLMAPILALSIVLPMTGHAQNHKNHALVLDGIDDYVTVPDTVPLRLSTNDFTFCAWVYLESYAKYNSPIVFKRTGTPTDIEGYILSIGGTSLPEVSKRFYYKVKGGNSPAVVSNSEIPLRQWTHLAMVHNIETQTATIFINGEYDAEVPNILTPGLANTIDLHIGADSITNPTPGYEYFFHGMLDEIQFWSRKLTTEEINAFKKKPLSGEEDGLIGYWRFQKGTTEDLSGNDHDGTAGPNTETKPDTPPVVTISPAVSIIANNCMPTTILELQYKTNLSEEAWTPITREFRTLIDGGRVYSDPVIDDSRLYRLLEIEED